MEDKWREMERRGRKSRVSKGDGGRWRREEERWREVERDRHKMREMEEGGRIGREMERS